ncbi:hypothetical protein D3C75_395570 [compost metagenome]
MRDIVELLIRINLQPYIIPLGVLERLKPFLAGDILQGEDIVITVYYRLIEVISGDHIVNIVWRIEHEADLIPEQLQRCSQLGQNIIDQRQVILERSPLQLNGALKGLAREQVIGHPLYLIHLIPYIVSGLLHPGSDIGLCHLCPRIGQHGVRDITNEYIRH